MRVGQSFFYLQFYRIPYQINLTKWVLLEWLLFDICTLSVSFCLAGNTIVQAYNNLYININILKIKLGMLLESFFPCKARCWKETSGSYLPKNKAGQDCCCPSTREECLCSHAETISGYTQQDSSSHKKTKLTVYEMEIKIILVCGRKIIL